MITGELFFGVALFAAIWCVYASWTAIRQAEKMLTLSKSRGRFLYTVALVVPLIGFILTRNLIRTPR